MNDTITIDGVKYRRVEEEMKPKTGYERVDDWEKYYYSGMPDNLDWHKDVYDGIDESYYDVGNYYNDKQLVKNNARADTLMRRLRQWQALNDEPVGAQNRWIILYEDENFDVDNFGGDCKIFGSIYFSTPEKAKEAIKVFHDELLWYFTEYQQRLDEPECG